MPYLWQSEVPVLRHLLGTWLIIPVEQGVENEGTLYSVAFVDELRDQESPKKILW